MKNYVFCILVLVGLCLSSNSWSRSLDDIQEQGTIIVAVYSDYPPFSYLDEDERPVGIDVDIAKKIAKNLEVELDFIWMTPGETSDDDLRNYIWKGHIIHKFKADLMMRAPYDRKYSMKRDDVGLLVHELVHMFGPYHSESWQIVHNVERLPDVPTMSMFQYHKIGVENDSIPYFYLNSAFAGGFRENTRDFVTNKDAINAMQKGEVDAVMGLRSQISSLHATLPSEDYKLASNAFPLIGKQKWDIGMAVHNDFRALAYASGDVVTELIMSGEMQKIFDKHNTIYQIPDYYKTE